MNWKLKIFYDPSTDRVVIIGDEKGFEHLIYWCEEVIRRGKLASEKDPYPHVHLQWQTNNTIKGSTHTILIFSEDPEDYVGNNQKTEDKKL